MKKKVFFYLGLFLVYLVFCYSVHEARVDLRRDTFISYSGAITSIIGFEESSEKFSFCVTGPLKSKTSGEYQIDVPLTAPKVQPALSEYTRYTARDDTQYLHPEPKNIYLGCNKKLKDTNKDFVSLDAKYERVILIRKPGHHAIKISVPTIVEFHSSPRQKRLSKVLDVLDLFTIPGQYIYWMFVLLAWALGIIKSPLP